MTPPDILEKLVSLCKRRGFVFQSSEIYGGLGSVWDYGPLGVELKRNLQERWWSSLVRQRDDIEGIDSAILMHPRVWEASGHVSGFVDPLIDCKTCKGRFRADKLEDAQCLRKPSKKPGQTPDCALTEPRQFNLMFKTHIGPVEDSAAVIYLRPETAQGTYVNFLNVQQSTRQRVPFGIAQIGKSFRNEITPGNFVFRTLEFEQMELEYFVEPGTDEQWFDHWVGERERWYIELGIRPENLRRYEHPTEKLSHYSKRTVDIEYRFPFGDGWGELEGIANRSKGPDGTSWDLYQHEQVSGQRLTLFDEDKKLHVRPGVVEPAAGLTRAALTFLIDAFDEEVLDPAKNDMRTVLHLHPAIAPYKACVLPLYRNKPDLVSTARAIYEDLRRRWMITFDSGSNVGKLYRRQDEIGTPYCITVDFQTLEDQKVTIRDRDSMDQTQFGRVPIADLRNWLEAHLDY
jgi:glycyl-tRNA synthetase